MQAFKRFLRDESGAAAIEYGLLAGLMAVAIILVMRRAGTALSGTFNKIASNLG
jgi:pilus assembly protein Flp/PilA